MLKNVIFFVFLTILPFNIFGQADNHDTSLGETGIWNGVYLKVEFSEKLGYYGEHH